MKLSGRNKIKPEFNMSSMTDVVFLLLIFFMIASTLAKQLNTIEVKLPQAEGKSENRNTVAVTIRTSNRFYIDEQAVSKRNLENRLIGQMKSLSSPSVILRADKKVPLDDVVYVMNIANRNGIKIVLAVDSQ
ncbi:MAG: biopolymer transporter ExbD [Flavobacteriales bacterium MED-G22]|nr:biopolymer transporter ExbD [Flavobacteriaceae bacterium]PDH43577.1 MAG: biopolymer transporter ExbD [Flavobacteriales bacterium MED-G22]|tara:strand:+ start:3318 stop:3713 length:396 start_codon:yes stop_codon:yes gene_type:complete